MLCYSRSYLVILLFHICTCVDGSQTFIHNVNGQKKAKGWSIKEDSSSSGGIKLPHQDSKVGIVMLNKARLDVLKVTGSLRLRSPGMCVHPLDGLRHINHLL